MTSDTAEPPDVPKLAGLTRAKATRKERQQDLRVLSDWAITQQMKFSGDKRKLMHLGEKSPNYTNTMMGTKLAINMQGGDLSSTRDNSLKTSVQSSSIIKKNEKM